MSKTLKISLGIVFVILLLYGVARFTGALQFYNISAPSSEPNVKTGSKILVSNLKAATRGSIAAHKQPMADTMSAAFQEKATYGQTYLFRICAMAGDIMEMKDGVFFVNGRNADAAINLYHLYMIPKSFLPEIDKIADPDLSMSLPLNDSMFMVNLTDEMVRKLPPEIKVQKYIWPADTSTHGAFMWYNQNPKKWTVDNFGPLTVPAGYAFLMGDNRQNALDSRYTGFVKMSDIKGIML